MNESDRRVLDDIEGVGRGYEVDEVSVPGFGKCFTYVASHTHIDDVLQPFDWYREMVLLGCLRNAFPAPYCERIAALPVIEDTHPARREKNWRTVERLRQP